MHVVSSLPCYFPVAFAAPPPLMLVPLIVACALFMENMDSTVLSTSLPLIAKDLGESPITLKLALTTYLISLAVFIPISGWIADRFGTRNVFRFAIALFVVGSIFCGISQNLPELVAARFLQGVGGAMMVPVGRLALLKSVEKREMVRALNYLTIPALVGPVLGPPLGGFITTYWHWRWIFFINIPIGVLGFVLATKFIPDLYEDDRPPLDVRGFILSGLGLSLLMLGLSTIGRHLIATPIALGLVAAGALLSWAYWRHAHRTEHPLMRMDLFKVQTFRAGVLGGALFRTGVGATPFLLPLMLQLGFGMSPMESGALTFISAAGAMFMKTLSQRILHHWGFRTVLTVNALITAVTIAGYGLFTDQTSHLVIMATLLLGGCFRSLQFTSLNAISYADIPPHRMSQATSLASVSQQLSLSMGITIGAAVLQASSVFHGRDSVTAVDFPWAFLTVGLVALTSAISVARLSKDAGNELAQRA